MLPCNSPPTTTTAASTCPVKCAPGSMLKLPSMRTSPLKRPAMRTLPEPSILPSMVRLAAITDSPPASRAIGRRRRGRAARRGGQGGLVRTHSALGGRSRRGGGGGAMLPAGGGVIGSFRGAGAGEGFSFQSAILDSPACEELKTTRYRLKMLSDQCLRLETVRGCGGHCKFLAGAPDAMRGRTAPDERPGPAARHDAGRTATHRLYCALATHGFSLVPTSRPPEPGRHPWADGAISRRSLPAKSRPGRRRVPGPERQHADSRVRAPRGAVGAQGAIDQILRGGRRPRGIQRGRRGSWCSAPRTARAAHGVCARHRRRADAERCASARSSFARPPRRRRCT